MSSELLATGTGTGTETDPTFDPAEFKSLVLALINNDKTDFTQKKSELTFLINSLGQIQPDNNQPTAIKGSSPDFLAVEELKLCLQNLRTVYGVLSTISDKVINTVDIQGLSTLLTTDLIETIGAPINLISFIKSLQRHSSNFLKPLEIFMKEIGTILKIADKEIDVFLKSWFTVKNVNEIGVECLEAFAKSISNNPDKIDTAIKSLKTEVLKHYQKASIQEKPPTPKNPEIAIEFDIMSEGPRVVVLKEKVYPNSDPDKRAEQLKKIIGFPPGDHTMVFVDGAYYQGKHCNNSETREGPILIIVLDHHDGERFRKVPTLMASLILLLQDSSDNTRTTYVLESPSALDHDCLLPIILEHLCRTYPAEFKQYEGVLKEICFVLGMQDIFCGGIHETMNPKMIEILKKLRSFILPNIERITMKSTGLNQETLLGKLQTMLEEDAGILFKFARVLAKLKGDLTFEQENPNLANWYPEDIFKNEIIKDPVYNLKSGSALEIFFDLIGDVTPDQFIEILNFLDKKLTTYPFLNKDGSGILNRFLTRVYIGECKGGFKGDIAVTTNEEPDPTETYDIHDINGLIILFWHGEGGTEPLDLKIKAAKIKVHLIISIRPPRGGSYPGNFTITALKDDNFKGLEELVELFDTIISNVKGLYQPVQQLKGGVLSCGCREEGVPLDFLKIIKTILEVLEALPDGEGNLTKRFYLFLQNRGDEGITNLLEMIFNPQRV
jgi:hypothetical protein